MTAATTPGAFDELAYADRPVRYCHTCDTHDRAPKLRAIANKDDIGSDTLHHVDCATPQQIADANVHPDVLAAYQDGYGKGLKDDALIEHVYPTILAAAQAGHEEANHHTATGLPRNESAVPLVGVTPSQEV